MRGFGIGVRMDLVVGLEIRIDGRGERGFHDFLGGGRWIRSALGEGWVSGFEKRGA